MSMPLLGTLTSTSEPAWQTSRLIDRACRLSAAINARIAALENARKQTGVRTYSRIFNQRLSPTCGVCFTQVSAHALKSARKLLSELGMNPSDSALLQACDYGLGLHLLNV